MVESKVYLVRSVADIKKAKKMPGCFAISDYPALRATYSQIDVHSTVEYIDKEFWREVIELRETFLSSFDLIDLKKIDAVVEQNIETILFKVRFLLADLAYEILLAKRIIEKERVENINFGEKFLISIIRNSLAQKTKLNENFFLKILILFNSVKIGVGSQIRFVLFSLGLKLVSRTFRYGTLCFDTGSGLKSWISGRTTELGGDARLFYIVDASRTESLVSKLRWIFNLFVGSNNFSGLCLPSADSFKCGVDFKKFKVEGFDSGRLRWVCERYEIEKRVGIGAADLQTFLLGRLDYFLRELVRDEFVGESLVTAMHPRMFVAQHSLGLSRVIANSCRSFDCSTLLISHGSHILNEDPILQKEWSVHASTMLDGPFDYSAIQTPASDVFFRANNRRSAGVKTGPLILQISTTACDKDLRDTLIPECSNKIILLHASTPKTPGSQRPLLYESLDEYVENIRLVTLAVQKIPNIHIAIRFRAQEGINRYCIEKCLSGLKQWSLHEGGVFADYLSVADALMSYSSTTIEQAFFLGKPVLLLDGGNGYRHFSSVALGLPDKEFVDVKFLPRDSLAKDLADIVKYLDRAGTGPRVFDQYLAFSERNVDVDSVFQKI